MNDNLLGSFVWCELMTINTDAAGSFYRSVVGWKTAPWAEDPVYTTLLAGSRPVAGMMSLPDEARQLGAPPNWMMYVGTPDLEGTAAEVARLGGRVLRQPDTIADGGRFAVVQDRQGAVFGLFTPAHSGPRKRPPEVGDFSWYELYTPDPGAAWTFYSTLFGWERTSAMDMGEMGTYQLFGRGGGVPSGGIMKPPPGVSAAWLPYILVEDAKAAAARAARLGARIVNGPMEVPGGDWIAQGLDPQGAMFAVHSLKRVPKQSVATTPARTKPMAKKKGLVTKGAAKPAAKRAPAAKARVAKAKAPAPRKAARKSPKKPVRRAGSKASARRPSTTGARRAGRAPRKR